MLGTPLLRLRSDQQLVALFREGNEEAFRIIHDRYRARLLAYIRQMLPGRPADIEDALQDVFVRSYAGLRTSRRELTLRPWLYRIAHNRCIDELRRPLAAPDLLELPDRPSDCDPVAESEQRESLRRLVVDIGRLPDQQRSALLMREMSGMAYADVACALGISVPAVKSLLVRARVGLAQALEARDAACADIRRELAEAHEEGVRPSWMARRHLRDCAGCRVCRVEMRAQRRQVAALAPTIGPLAVLAKLFGVGGGGTATAASAGGATAAGAGGTVTAASGLATVTVGHVATILAAAVVTAGGAVAVQQTVATHGSRHAKHVTHQAAPASSVGAANAATMRVPAAISPAHAARHAQASPIHRPPAAAPSSTATGSERWGGGGPVAHVPAAKPSDGAATETASSTATSTTCTPPPTACTASDTTTCSAGSSSSTSSTPQTATGTTTTETTTTTGSGTPPGTTSGTTTGTAAGTTVSACSTATPSTGTQGTQPTGTGQPGTEHPVKPS